MRGRPSTMKRLPEKLRTIIEQQLSEKGFHDYDSLTQWIRQQGHEVSIRSLQRAATRLKRDSTTRLASGKPRAKAEAARGGSGTTIEGLVMLVQKKLCSALTEMGQLEQGDMSRLAHAVAHLTQAAVSLQRWTDELNQRRRERERAAPQLKSEVRAGLSPATSQALRNSLLGIAQFKPKEMASENLATDPSEVSIQRETRVSDEFEKGQEQSDVEPLSSSSEADSFDEGENA